eukprot:15455068-Alexandrium_andersonii.AAC.1
MLSPPLQEPARSALPSADFGEDDDDSDDRALRLIPAPQPAAHVPGAAASSSSCASPALLALQAWASGAGVA